MPRKHLLPAAMAELLLRHDQITAHGEDRLHGVLAVFIDPIRPLLRQGRLHELGRDRTHHAMMRGRHRHRALSLARSLYSSRQWRNADQASSRFPKWLAAESPHLSPPERQVLCA